jgi:hypothetical protein
MSVIKKILSGLVVCTTLLATANTQPTDNVVAYYPFNANADDVSGNGESGTVSSATLTVDRLDKASAAYLYNGTNALIYIPSDLLPGNTAFAVSFWFKFNGTVLRPADYGEQLIDFRGQYNFNISYLQNNHPSYPKSVAFNVANSASNTICISASSSIEDNTWYHVVASYGDNTSQLYLNGKLVDAKSQTPPAVVTGYNNTIGKDYNMNRDRLWFNGIIDEVIVYKRALTASEVLAIYNKQKVQSDLPELYGPVSFNYDNAGNRTSRNIISLKKTITANTRDSSDYASTKENSQEYTDLDQEIKIYPNPTKGQLQTDLRGFDFTQKNGIYVYSQAGVLLQQKVPASSSNVIELSGYPSGIYIMRIILGDKVSEWKIIKE